MAEHVEALRCALDEGRWQEERGLQRAASLRERCRELVGRDATERLPFDLKRAHALSPLIFVDLVVAPAAHNAALTAVADTVRTRTSTLHLEPAGRYAAKAAAPGRFRVSDTIAPAFAADLEWFDRGQSGPALTAMPLWPGGAAPDDWASLSQRLQAALLSLDPSWEVWTKWYDARIRGAPFDVEIERKRVLVPSEVWSQPPASANTYIAQLLK